jgi:hypothetical protein
MPYAESVFDHAGVRPKKTPVPLALSLSIGSGATSKKQLTESEEDTFITLNVAGVRPSLWSPG